MKRLFFVIMISFLAGAVMAQPAARRREQQKQNTSNSSSRLTQRAQMDYPTEAAMPEDVVWRRDIYRELDLTNDANAGLYYPVEPQGTKMNLFTYIFKLALAGYVDVYEYRLDGNESFEDSAKVKMKDLLNNYHIFFEEKNGKIHVENSDIPSAEVKSYYIKESSYFDQNSSTFHTKVLALCPIMSRDDDFGDGASKYPLFWVKYEDLATYLSRLTTMTSSLNNAATMSLDDYFTLNKYRGKIYKTNNMLGKTLAQYCPTDSAMAKEQKKIETELAAFEKNIWGDQVKKDSLDSIAKLDANQIKKVKKSRRSSSSTVKARRSSSKSSSSSSSARVTVRRERH
jgi:gliding motility associated protien GldN